MAVVRTENDPDIANFWRTPRKRPSPEIPEIHPPATLDELLARRTFIDYGTLSQYRTRHEEGHEHHAYTAIQLMEKIQTKTLQLAPHEQASLLIRYIFHKEPDPINYITNNYAVPTITWELALTGYEEGTRKARAWEKLLQADTKRTENLARRRQFRRIPLDIPPSEPAIPPPTTTHNHPSSPTRR